jgi:hypothetical protein
VIVTSCLWGGVSRGIRLSSFVPNHRYVGYYLSLRAVHLLADELFCLLIITASLNMEKPKTIVRGWRSSLLCGCRKSGCNNSSGINPAGALHILSLFFQKHEDAHQLLAGKASLSKRNSPLPLPWILTAVRCDRL